MDATSIIYIIIAFFVGIMATWLVMAKSRKSGTSDVPIPENNDKSLSNIEVEALVKKNEEQKQELALLKEKCSSLEDSILKSIKKRETELKTDFDKILEQANKEKAALTEALKMAENGQIDESVNKRLAEAQESIKSLTKKVTSLEDEIEEAEEEQEKLEKKLKAEKLHHQDTIEELEKSSREKKRLTEDIEQLKQDLSHNIELLNLKKESIEFVQAILSAPISSASDIKSLYRAIDFFEAFLRGQFMDCNAYLYNTYEGLSFNDISGRSGFAEKKKVFLQLFEEWASVKRKSWLDQKTTIAFVGEFSAGKTSIVNRILSQDNPNIPRLPVSTKATTAIPTYIAGGVAETYNFVTPDDKFKTISENIFKKVSKEILDEIKGVSSLIKYFVMTYKNPNLNGLSILDTPGFNSNDEEDKKRTVHVINECDVLFWVVDVNNGTVNRSSIARIKEDLRKPIIVVINKVDTKEKSEVDKVEQLIRSTFADEGVDIEQVVRFSSKAPLSDIMNPIKSVKHDASRDSFINLVGEDLNQLSSILEKEVKNANRVYQNKNSATERITDNYISALRTLVTNCEEAAGIPHWETHTFRKDRYEMSAVEGGSLISLLEEISTNNCQVLADIYDKESEAVADAQQAYSDYVDFKMSWQKIDDCIKEFKKVSKGLK